MKNPINNSRQKQTSVFKLHVVVEDNSEIIIIDIFSNLSQVNTLCMCISCLIYWLFSLQTFFCIIYDKMIDL